VDATRDEALGVAGIKGGNLAAISEATQHILIEAANFDAVHIRKSAQALGLRTAASTRFEHALSPELTMYALHEAAELIAKIAATEETRVDGYVDVRAESGEAESVAESRRISISLGDMSGIIGSAVGSEDVETSLKRLGFSFSRTDDGAYSVTPPFERLDLTSREDLAEEIARVRGYEHITLAPPRPPERAPEVNKRYEYTRAIRHLLTKYGFSEVYTYAFAEKGVVELANPLASDKKFLRDSLVPGVSRALEQNLTNADLLGLDRVKIFEVGTVFRADGERLAVALAVADTKSYRGAHAPEEELDHALAALRELCGEVFLKKNVDTREVEKGRAIYEIGTGKVNFVAQFEELSGPAAPRNAGAVASSGGWTARVTQGRIRSRHPTQITGQRQFLADEQRLGCAIEHIVVTDAAVEEEHAMIVHVDGRFEIVVHARKV
jgi:phenylalanyl-tRNA synthetase beta subunit